MPERRDPVVITDAPMSYPDQLAYRKRRYKLLMGLRIPLLVAAVVVYLVWALPWVAVALIVASVPLPWTAVLIANDRPVPRKIRGRGYRPPRSALTAPPDASSGDGSGPAALRAADEAPPAADGSDPDPRRHRPDGGDAGP